MMIAFHEIREFSPAVNAYAAGLAKLHDLELAGRFESQEAEAVRDEMDLPWRYLNAREHNLVDKLAASLNRLLEPKSGRPDTVAASLIDSLLEKLSKCDLNTILDDIDNLDSQLPEAMGACLRGLSWREWNVPEAALPFFRFAYSKRPDSQSYLLQLISALLATHRFAEGQEIASQNVQRNLRPEVRLKLAEAIIADALERDEADHSLLLQAKQVATDALTALEQDENAEPEIAAAGYFFLALCYLVLGDEAAAKEACREAIRIDPTSVDALAMWGQFNSEDISTGDRKAFQRGRISEILARTTDGPANYTYN